MKELSVYECIKVIEGQAFSSAYWTLINNQEIHTSWSIAQRLMDTLKIYGYLFSIEGSNLDNQFVHITITGRVTE